MTTVLRYSFCLVSACLLLLGCGKHEYPRVLTQVDSLADVKPDSAEALSHQIRSRVRSMSDEDQWYYRLLVMKIDAIQDNTPKDDKEALALVAHYEEKGDAYLLAQTYYYAGCTYQMLNDALVSVDYFQKSLDVLSASNMDDFLRSKCYYMLGEIFISQDLYPEAITMHRKALSLDRKNNHRQRMVYDYIDLAWSYGNTNAKDKEISCLNQAKEIAVQIKDSASCSEIEAQLASISVFHTKDKEQARRHLQRAFASCSELNKSSLYAIASYTYDFLGLEDSARYYVGLLSKMESVYAKQRVHEWFTLYYGKHSDFQKMREHLSEYKFFSDSIRIISSTESVAKANAIYNYKLREKKNIELTQKNAHQRFVVFLLLFLLILWLTVSVFGFLYWRMKAQRRMKEMRKIIDNMETLQEENLEKNKKEIARLTQELSSVKDSAAAYRYEQENQKLELENTVKVFEQKKKTLSQKDFIVKKTSLYKELKDQVATDSPMSKDQTDRLEQILFEVYPQFKDGLYCFKQMNDGEFRVCLLLKVGFSFMEISTLVAKSHITVYSICRRLYKKNFGKDAPPKEWKSIINSL